MKRFVLIFPLLLALFLIAPFTAKACPAPINTTVVQVDWHTIFSLLSARNIYIFGHFLDQVSITSPVPIYANGNSVVSVIFANDTAQIASFAVDGINNIVAIQNAPTLSKGLYITAGYQNATGIYALIFDIDGKIVASVVYPNQANVLLLNFNGPVYFSSYVTVNMSQSINTVVNMLKDLRNQGGGILGWLFINNTGPMPISYYVIEPGGGYNVPFSFNSTQYALVIDMPPFTVGSAGPGYTLCAGAYVLESYSEGNSTVGYSFQDGLYLANYNAPLYINTVQGPTPTSTTPTPTNTTLTSSTNTTSTNSTTSSTSTSTSSNDTITPQSLMPILLLILLADFVRDILEKRR